MIGSQGAREKWRIRVQPGKNKVDIILGNEVIIRRRHKSGRWRVFLPFSSSHLGDRRVASGIQSASSFPSSYKLFGRLESRKLACTHTGFECSNSLNWQQTLSLKETEREGLQTIVAAGVLFTYFHTALAPTIQLGNSTTVGQFMQILHQGRECQVQLLCAMWSHSSEQKTLPTVSFFSVHARPPVLVVLPLLHHSISQQREEIQLSSGCRGSVPLYDPSRFDVAGYVR